jgi:hypothetical protein
MSYSSCGRCGEPQGNSDASQGGQYDKNVIVANWTSGSVSLSNFYKNYKKKVHSYILFRLSKLSPTSKLLIMDITKLNFVPLKPSLTLVSPPSTLWVDLKKWEMETDFVFHMTTMRLKILSQESSCHQGFDVIDAQSDGLIVRHTLVLLDGSPAITQDLLRPSETVLMSESIKLSQVV